jgi:hypothetical protein
MSRHPKILSRSFAGGVMSPEMFSRFDDLPFQFGAAEITNMICKAHGPLLRRPGSQLVRKAKNSSKRVALLPFKFSESQAMVLEAGRHTVSPTPSHGPTEIGYFRIHDEGGTRLYSTVPTTYVTEKTVSVVSVANDELEFSSSHLFNTGDPIVIQPGVDSGGNVTFSTTTHLVSFVGSAGHLSNGAQVIFSGAGQLPSNLQEYRLYYITEYTAGSAFRISNEVGGTPINFATAGGTAKCVVMPFCSHASGTKGLFANTVYYAISTSSTKLRVALSRNDAIAGTPVYFNILTDGMGASAGLPVLKVHYAYLPGDKTNWTGVGSGFFYCLRPPYGDPGSQFVFTNDHLGHPPPDWGQYWVRIAGTSASVTVSTVTHFVDWGAAHGLSNGDPVIFSGSVAPTPVVFGQVYYVRAKTTNTFRVSATPSGPLITFSGAGTSVVVLANSFIEVPHYYGEDELFELTYAQSNDVLSLASKRHPFAEFRRYSAETFTLQDTYFVAGVQPPANVITYTRFAGEGFNVTVAAAGSAPGTPARLTTPTKHQLAKGEPVYITGLSSQGIPDNFYLIHDDTVSSTVDFYLRYMASGENVVASGTGGAGVLNSSSTSVNTTNYYVVTSIDSNGVESYPSNVLTITNNLYVSGSYNTITWDSRANAVRYRIYKSEFALFGLIGETDGLYWKDDNISPDLAISPPIIDGSLLRSASVTFDTTSDRVTWIGHGLEAGAPIIFYSNGDLPSPLVEGTTYYVTNPSADAFGLSTTEDLLSPVALSGGSGQHKASAGYFPGAVGYFEQRRVLGGSLSRAQDIWMTASGTETDLSYSLPVVDSDRVQFRISSREFSAVKHVVSLSHLALLSSSAEYRVTPINTDAITPTSISVRPQSYVGAASVQPSVVNANVVFAAARGGHVRELGYNADVSGYLTGDLSLRATHLFDDQTIVQQSYQKAPHPVIWFVSSTGNLLGLSYVPDEKVGAWHTHETDGVFESVCVIPEGDEDRVYVVVKRTINSQEVRFVERLSVQAVSLLADAVYMDCALTYTGAATTTLSGLDHLEGKTVVILADGVVQPSKTVVGGAITLATAASKVHVGLATTARLRTLPLSMMQGVDAYGSGKQKNVNAAWVRVFESGRFRIGPTSNALVYSPAPAAGQLMTDMVAVTLSPTWDDDGQIVVEQTEPLPLTIVGVTLEVAAGG